MLPAHSVVVDLEITGTSPTHNRIIEIGLCEIHHGQVVEEWASLVNPQVRISFFITQYIGIATSWWPLPRSLMAWPRICTNA